MLDNFDRADTVPMKLPGETFAAYAARVWPTRSETGLPHEATARYLFSLASVNPHATGAS
jgi:hypothetical protein